MLRQDSAIYPKVGAILPGIQLLRGCCALLVVMAHANLMMGYPQFFGVSPFALHQSGLFGVAIFFVISGFIIAIVSFDETGAPRLSRVEFAWRRFVRIMPFLWISVAGYNLLSFAGAHRIEWWALARALTLWPVGELKPNVVWSLRHEILFYALTALLMLGARRRTWLLVAWFLAPLIFWPFLDLIRYPVPARIPEDLNGWQELYQVVLLGANSGANLQFGTGFLLGWMTLKRHPAMALRFDTLRWALVTPFAAAIVAEEWVLPVGLARDLAWTALAAPCVWLAIVSAARPGFWARCGLLFGNASFAIYLVHNGALLALFSVGRHWTMLPESALFLIFTAGAVGIGLLAHRFVEKPLIGRLAHGRPLAPWLRRYREADLARPATSEQ
jgi:peptidoglycan/LPS O-acetylase OafA/YrhL